jgi:lipopolysaccharide export system protein LptA
MSKQCFRNSLTAAITAIMFFSAGLARAEINVREPMVITSDSLQAEKLSDVVTFVGNVTLKRAMLTLTSEKMIVSYDEGLKDVREIEADGNVVVKREGKVAYARQARYFSREEKIVLLGDARVVENGNQLDGDTITIFLREDRTVVDGGKVVLRRNQRNAGADPGK